MRGCIVDSECKAVAITQHLAKKLSMGVWQQITVEPVRFLFLMGVFMQDKTIKDIVLRKVCQSESINGTLCDDELDGDVTHGGAVRSNVYMMWCFKLDICANLLGALVSCVYGPISDCYGRRGLLLLPSVGMILGSASLFVVLYVDLPVYYLFISSAFMGLFGYYQSSYIVTMSSICDITTHADRSLRLGIMEAMGFIGGPIGSLIASSLIYFQHHAVLIFITILIQTVILLYVCFFMQETLPARYAVRCTREEFTAGKTFLRVWWSLKTTLMVYVIWRTENRRQLLLINQTVGILSSLGSSGERDLTILYTMPAPLNWDSCTLLAYFSSKDAVKGMILVAGMPVLFAFVSHWTVRLDMLVAMGTSLSTSSSLVLMSFANSTLMMMLAPVVGCLGGFPNTLISSIKCKLVEPDEFGALFACTVFIQTVCSVVGRVLFRKLYTATLSTYPRLPFLGMGVFFVMLLSIITYMWCLSGHLDKSSNKGENSTREHLMNAYRGQDEDESLLRKKPE